MWQFTRPEAAELRVTKASHALFMPSARSCIVSCCDCHVSTRRGEEGRTRDASHYLAQVVLCEVLVGPEADILQEMHVSGIEPLFGSCVVCRCPPMPRTDVISQAGSASAASGGGGGAP